MIGKKKKNVEDLEKDFQKNPGDYEIIKETVDFQEGTQICYVKKKGEKESELTAQQEDMKEKIMESLVLMCKQSEHILEAVKSIHEGSYLMRLMVLKKQINAVLNKVKKDNPKEYDYFDQISKGLQVMSDDEGTSLKEKMRKEVKDGRKRK